MYNIHNILYIFKNYYIMFRVRSRGTRVKAGARQNTVAWKILQRPTVAVNTRSKYYQKAPRIPVRRVSLPPDNTTEQEYEARCLLGGFARFFSDSHSSQYKRSSRRSRLRPSKVNRSLESCYLTAKLRVRANFEIRCRVPSANHLACSIAIVLLLLYILYKAAY